jgi:hypothetical protein
MQILCHPHPEEDDCHPEEAEAFAKRRTPDEVIPTPSHHSAVEVPATRRFSNCRESAGNRA